MSNFPNKIDDDVTLPPVNNNLTEIGGEAINALREAVLNIEESIGVGAQGTLSSVAERISVSIDGDGYIKPSSVLWSEIFPIKDDKISPKSAGYDGISESKINLSYTTSELYSYYQDLSSKTLEIKDWQDNYGYKIRRHVFENEYNHYSNAILFSQNTSEYLKNRFSLTNPTDPSPEGFITRNNSNLFELITDLNSDYVIHQKMDGYEISDVKSVVTLSGNFYPSNFAHHAAGIYLDSSSYQSLPTTIDNVQDFANYIDSNSMMLLGSRVQSLFTSGISRASRSSSMTNDGHGTNIIPETEAICYLTGDLDNPSTGDDIIRFTSTDSSFASKFTLIKPGDIATVTYSNFGISALVSVGQPSDIAINSVGNKAFVTSKATNDVKVINLNNNTILSSISVGNNPTSIAVSPDGYTAIVACDNDNSNIYKIDLTSSIATPHSSGKNSKHVAINKSGTKAVIANYETNNVSIFDILTNEIAVLSCGTNPIHVAISPSETLAAVANNGSNNITFINLNTYQVINTIDCGTAPVSIAFSPTESHLVVANSGSDSATLIRIALSAPVSVVSVLCDEYQKSVAMAPNGRFAYLSNDSADGANGIVSINLATEKAVAFVNCDANPGKLSITPDGSKLLISCSTNKLNVLNTKTNEIIAKVPVGTDPQSIAVTPNGTKAAVVNSGGDVSIVSVGDIGSVQTQFTVKEKKTVWQPTGTEPNYSIRIDGKNLFNSNGSATTSAKVRIDKALFNINKGGVLSVSAAKTSDSNASSLIISQPRGAVAIGNGFNPSQFSNNCYNLYLILYPNGDSTDYYQLNPIDVTGNKGSKPGSYSLDKVVEETNKAFRANNYRFVAFSHNGNFGVMLADSYRNCSFSIVAGEIDTSTPGSAKYKQTSTKYVKNIISYNSSGIETSDPLGFGLSGSNIATLPINGFGSSYSPSPAECFNFPTKIFYPLKRNNFYVDGAGIEIERLQQDKDQFVDSFGDGYWESTLTNVNSNFDFTYNINKNLKSSGLQAGKTAVVQPINYEGVLANFGRFVIKEVNFNEDSTSITFDRSIVEPSLPPGSASEGDGYKYAIYFNSDSVGFNTTNVFEASNNESSNSFKKHFEIFIDKNGKSISSERARMLVRSASYTDYVVTGSGATLKTSASLGSADIDIVRVSPKLRGYSYGTASKISLKITYSETTGNFTCYLYDSGASSSSNLKFGPPAYGKSGEVIRVYDDTGVDYIDFKFDLFESASFSAGYASIQLFPSLYLDDELLPISSCQLETSTKSISNILDLRQFGNVSEKDISNSLINYINVAERVIHSNGVINGFDATLNESSGTVSINIGGTALVNGKFVQANPEVLKIPTVNEIDSAGNTNPNLWAICINENSQYEFVAICDRYSGFPTTLNSGSRNVLVRDASSTDSLNNFYINSLQFKKLINDSKHLTPVCVLKTTVGWDGSDYTYNDSEINDVRRFINNEPLNNSFTWASASSELTSYFKTFDAVKNWINYYGDTSNVIKIRGTIVIDSSSNDFSVFTRPVLFEGEGSYARFDINSATFDVGQNISFKDVKFKFVGDDYCTISQSSASGYCQFENIEFLSSSSDNWFIFNLKNYNKFTNCLFSTRIKSLIITDYCEFINCNFDKLYSSTSLDNDSLIKLQNYNKFINCKFNEVQIESSADNAYWISYDGIYGNENIFDSCTFSSCSSNSNAINLRNNNKIFNCKFLQDLTIEKTFIKLLSGNVVENLLFGESLGNTDSYKSLIQNSTEAGFSIINIQSKNVIKNITADSFIGKSQDGYAIIINGSENIIDQLSVTTISANYSSFVFNQFNNKIINSKFECMSKLGIYFSDSGISSTDNIEISDSKITYAYTGLASDDDNVRASLGGLIYFNKSVKNVNIKNCIFNKNSSSREKICQFTGQVLAEIDSFPPLISFYAKDSDCILNSVKIDRCNFIGNNSGNIFYPAIAIINGSESASDIFSLKNVYITNNICLNNCGLIIAGEPGKSNLTADNVIISQNKFSYISSYSSPYLINGNILIDGNSCYAILSLNNTATDKIKNLTSSGDMTISNNSCQTINVYVAGN